jgi:SAM-dependent methyltransferase
MSGFSGRDPNRAEFWDERYRAGFMPWDARGVPAALVEFVARRAPGRRVLVPGCGSAYEAGWLDAQGFDVAAIDISAAALDRARSVLGNDIAGRVVHQADFFAYDAVFDWIYERALLAALPPARWPAYVSSASRLLAPRGLVAGFFFVDDAVAEPRRGPPFAARGDELVALFEPSFARVEHVPVPPEQSIDVFAGHEYWMVWRRSDMPSLAP